MAAPVVLADANVLYPNQLRNLLMQLGLHGLLVLRWSDRIQDEWQQALRVNRPDLDPARIARSAALMDHALPRARVAGTVPIPANLQLPDPHDHHVVAAAIAGEARAILTFNLADFPDEALLPFDVAAVHPDLFLLSLLTVQPTAFCKAVAKAREQFTRPPFTLTDYLTALATHGLPRVALALQRHEDQF
jgi:hypothetical protein